MPPAQVHSLYIINRSGSLVYNRAFSNTAHLESNTAIRLASTWYSVHNISMQISPVEGCTGMELLHAETFDLHCFSSLTGTKFLLIVEPKSAGVDVLMQRIYELYSDYVMKNPFYECKLIRVRTFATDPAEQKEGWLWQALASRNTKSRLQEVGVRAKKALGQNFMVNDVILARIVEAANIQRGDLVLEIGPGTGNLTRHLLAAGAHVVAIEKDEALYQQLESASKSRASRDQGTLRLLHADVLSVHLGALARQFAAQGEHFDPHSVSNHEVPPPSSSTISSRPVKLVANLPYNITSDFLKQALPLGDAISDLYLMLQDEVGQKMAKVEAGDDLYRAMSVRARFFSLPTYLFSIPRNAYFPQPNVTSCLVRFALRTSQDYPPLTKGSPAEWTAFVGLAFLSRRKMLKNNAARLYGEEQVAEALRQIGLDERIRAERLSVDQFVALFNILGPRGPGGGLEAMRDGFAKPRAAPRPPRIQEESRVGNEQGKVVPARALSVRAVEWPRYVNGPEPMKRMLHPDDPRPANRMGRGNKKRANPSPNHNDGDNDAD